MAQIIINADDFGLSDGVCRSILELFDVGAISNTTLMMACDDSPSRLRRWTVSSLSGRAGVHLQLSGGTPLSPAAEVPSLIDNLTGRFRTREELVDPNPAEVEREWRRQIESAAELLGAPPTHIDSHRGVSRIDNCIPIFIGLASEYGFTVRGAKGVTQNLMNALHIEGATDIVRDWTGKGLGPEALKLMIEAEVEAGAILVEVVTHPGYSDSYLEKVSTLNLEREGDHKSLMDLSSSGWFADSGHELASHPKLGQT